MDDSEEMVSAMSDALARVGRDIGLMLAEGELVGARDACMLVAQTHLAMVASIDEQLAESVRSDVPAGDEQGAHG